MMMKIKKLFLLPLFSLFSSNIYANDWSNVILTDNLKALDGIRIFSSSNNEEINIFYREPAFAQALGYKEKAVFMSFTLLNSSEVKSEKGEMDSHKPIYIQINNDDIVELKNIYQVDGPVRGMWFLLNPINPKTSCGILGKLIHSHHFKIIYDVYHSNEREIVSFETPKNINFIYNFLKLDSLKDCLTE